MTGRPASSARPRITTFRLNSGEVAAETWIDVDGAGAAHFGVRAGSAAEAIHLLCCYLERLAS